MLLSPTVWIILLATAVLAVAAVWIITLSSRRSPETDPVRRWEVQCPRCNRWKEMTPQRSKRLDPPDPSLQPGMQVAFANSYKCPYCGHRWQEKYLE